MHRSTHELKWSIGLRMVWVLFVFVFFLLLSSNVIYFSSVCPIEPMCRSSNENTVGSKDEICKYASLHMLYLILKLAAVFFLSFCFTNRFESMSQCVCIRCIWSGAYPPHSHLANAHAHLCHLWIVYVISIIFCSLAFLFTPFVCHTFRYFKTIYVVKLLCI